MTRDQKKAIELLDKDLTPVLFTQLLNDKSIRGAGALQSFATTSRYHSTAVTLRNCYTFLLFKDGDLESWRQNLFIHEKDDIRQELQTIIIEEYTELLHRIKMTCLLEGDKLESIKVKYLTIRRERLAQLNKAFSVVSVGASERLYTIKDGVQKPITIKDMPFKYKELRQAIMDKTTVIPSRYHVKLKRLEETVTQQDHGTGAQEHEVKEIKHIVHDIDEFTEKKLFWYMVGRVKNTFRRYILSTYASITTHASVDSQIKTIKETKDGDTDKLLIMDRIEDKASQMGYTTVELLESIRGALNERQYNYVTDYIIRDQRPASQSGKATQLIRDRLIRQQVVLSDTLNRLHI